MVSWVRRLAMRGFFHRRSRQRGTQERVRLEVQSTDESNRWKARRAVTYIRKWLATVIVISLAKSLPYSLITGTALSTSPVRITSLLPPGASLLQNDMPNRLDFSAPSPVFLEPPRAFPGFSCVFSNIRLKLAVTGGSRVAVNIIHAAGAFGERIQAPKWPHGRSQGTETCLSP